MDIKINPECAKWIEIVTRPIPIQSPSKNVKMELVDNNCEDLHNVVVEAILSYDSQNWFHHLFSFLLLHLNNKEYEQLLLLKKSYGGFGKAYLVRGKTFILSPKMNQVPDGLPLVQGSKAFISNPEMNSDDLRICFPFSKLKTSRKDPAQQGQILLLQGSSYNLGSRIVKLLKISAVDCFANIKYVEILDVELDIILDKVIKNLNLLKSEELFNDKRWPIIVVRGEYRCSICYANSSVNDDRNNILHLQSDVERCLQSNLALLDDLNQKPNWRDSFIRPFMNHVSIKANVPVPF